MKYFLLFLICCSTVFGFSQSDVAFPIEKWNPENPKAIPPLEMLIHIDTIREGLYKSVYGINLGYDTGEYFRGILYVHDDLIFAKKNDEPLYAAYDTSGKELIPPTFSNVRKGKKIAAVSKPNSFQFALLDSLGKEITDYIYDDIEFSYKLPGYRDFKIVAKRGEEIIGLDKNGKEIEIALHVKHTFRKQKLMELDKKTTDEIEGNFYQLFSDDENQYLVQYLFQKNSLGKKIIHVFTKEGKHFQIAQTISKRITNVNTTGEMPWLWLDLEQMPLPIDFPKSILKKLEEKDWLKSKENFSVKIKYPYKVLKIKGLNGSEVDIQSANENEITRLLQLLEIQNEMNNGLTFYPAADEKIPQIKVDLMTQDCFFSERVGMPKSFNRVILEDGKAFLVNVRKKDSIINGQSPSLILKDIFYKNAENKIVRGNLLGFYNKNAKRYNLFY